MRHGYEGAEILATVMNDIFDLVVNAVYERGGFVSTFAGDAFTAIFPVNEDVIPTHDLLLQVLACVDTIHTLFRQHGIQTTPYGQFALQFKVGLSQGTVDWGIVGDTTKAYFFRGAAIDGCAASEHQADKGDVIFDTSVAQRLRQIPGTTERGRSLRAMKLDRLAGGYYRIKALPDALREQVPQRRPPPDGPRPLSKAI
jgi:class 3 adenylate cyclase